MRGLHLFHDIVKRNLPTPNTSCKVNSFWATDKINESILNTIARIKVTRFCLKYIIFFLPLPTNRISIWYLECA